jgi:hypothetical protein
MKLYAGEIYAFALGGALSWLATYFYLTREKRVIAEIKSNLDTLDAYHDLTKPQRLRMRPPLFGGGTRIPLASDEQILSIYGWAVRKLEYLKIPKKQLSPTMLAAEIIICEELLGLTYVHALRALLRTKNLDELQKTLHNVTAEISAEENSN